MKGLQGNKEVKNTKENPWKEGWFLPLALVATTFVAFPNLNDPATLPRQLIWSTALLLILAHRIAKGRLVELTSGGLHAHVVVCLVLGFLAGGISLIGAFSLSEGLKSFLHYGFVCSSFWTLSLIITSERMDSRERLLWAVWVGAVLQAMLAFGDFALNPDSTIAPEGTQTNPNLLGSMLAICIPAGCYLAWYGRNGIRYVLIASLFMVLFTIWISESRAAMLILLLQGLLAGAFAVFSSFGTARATTNILMRVCGAIALIGVLFALLYVGWGRKEMPRNFRPLFDESSKILSRSNSMEVRMVLWNKSLQMMSKEPFTGVGAGNWKLEAPKYGVKGFDSQGRYGMVYYTHPHNDLLMAGAERGLLGMLAFAGFFGSLAVIALKRLGAEVRIREKWMVAASLGGILGFFVDGLFAFPWERIEMIAILSVYVVIISGNPIHKLPAWLHAVISFATALLLVLSISLAVYLLPKEASTLEMRTAKERKAWEEVEKQSIRSNCWWNRYEAQSAAPFAWYQSIAIVERGRLHQPGSKAYRDELQRAKQVLGQAKQYAPDHLAVLSEEGSTEAMLGNHLAAAQAFEKLTTAFPDHEEAWVNLAICYFQAGEITRAKQALSKVRSESKHPAFQSIRAALSQ